MKTVINFALLCFAATNFNSALGKPLTKGTENSDYCPPTKGPDNSGFYTIEPYNPKNPTHPQTTFPSVDKINPSKKKKSLPTCQSLCNDPVLDGSSLPIEKFVSKSFNKRNNDQHTVYKCHSYLAAYANWKILKKLGLPLPLYPLDPQMFTIDQKKLLGSKTKDLTQDGWRSVQSSGEFNTLFDTFIEQYRLQLCKAAALGVGDLETQNIFYRKNNDGKIEFVVADFDTRSKISMIPHYYTDLTLAQKRQLTNFVQGNLCKNLLEKVFQITSYPEDEKQIFLDSFKSYKKVVKRIENITDIEKLKDPKINPHLPSQKVLFGNPYFFGSGFGFKRGFATTNSSSIICECK